MSAPMLDNSCLFSALQPNSSSTTYVLPSDGLSLDPEARVRRVQEQVRQRLQERKKSGSLTRLDDYLSGPPDDGLPDSRGYHLSHAFTSRSMIQTPTRVLAVPTVPLRSSGFSSRSAVENSVSLSHRRSTAAQSSFHCRTRNGHSRSTGQVEQTGFPSDFHSVQVTVPPSGSLRRSLSGTLAQDKAFWQEEASCGSTYKGPAHRTINRIANRQQQQQQGFTLEREGWLNPSRGVTATENWGTQWQQQQVPRNNHTLGAGPYQVQLKRTASVRSVRSVGKGVDILDGVSIHSNDALAELQSLDMVTAVRYLSEPDAALQILGAAYIQHQCYHSNDAKNQVRLLHGISALMQLLSSDNLEIQQYAAGATRNLIYENAENKVALIDAGGLTRLVESLDQPDEELRKTITGILWNLSSRDNLKEKLCRDILSALTEKVLVPLCSNLPLSPSERDIFSNTSGCLRNLSSVNERTRQRMRDMRGLVDSLVLYIQQEDTAEDKGSENCLCVMRNLSYQLYSELPPSARLRLEGKSRASASRDIDPVGCFSVYNKKHQERKQNLNALSEINRQPRGAEWLWHPKVLTLYKNVIQNTDVSTTSCEAAIGALQNITTGDSWWPSVLVNLALEQEKILPLLLELIESSSEVKLRPLTGVLRNLARHTTNKEHFAKSVVSVIVSKLPSDGLQKTPSGEVVSNLCGVLNHLVSHSSAAARDIAFYNGLPKLVGIKTFHDSSPGSLKGARAAATVLYNMFQYNKLHKDYKVKGFSRRDFTDATF